MRLCTGCGAAGPVESTWRFAPGAVRSAAMASFTVGVLGCMVSHRVATEIRERPLAERRSDAECERGEPVGARTSRIAEEGIVAAAA